MTASSEQLGQEQVSIENTGRPRELERCYSEALGKLRHQIGVDNVIRHQPAGRVVRILDIGGGNGYFAVEMAKRHCFVELLDEDSVAIETARRNVATAGLGERVRLLRDDIIPTLPSYRSGSFNMVLCHHLIEYTNEYRTIINEASRVLKPQGVLSLIFENIYAEPLRLTLDERNPQAALALLTNNPTAPADTRALRPEIVSRVVNEAGLRLIGDYGIGIFNNYGDEEQRKQNPDFEAALLAVEQAASRLSHYLIIARYRQIIAVKPLSQMGKLGPPKQEGH